MKRHVGIWVLALCLMLSVFPFSAAAEDTADSYVMLRDTEDYTVYTRAQFGWSVDESDIYTSGSDSVSELLTSLKVVFKAAGAVSFDWSISGETTDFFAYRVSTEDYAVMMDVIGQTENCHTGKNFGTEEALTVAENDTLYLAYFRFSADSTGTATVSNLRLSPIVEGGDTLSGTPVVFDETKGSVTADWMKQELNINGQKYYTLSAASLDSLAEGQTYRLKATASEGNQFYGWVREYIVNGVKKYEFMPMKYYTLNTKKGSDELFRNEEVRVKNPELEVTLDGNSAYHAVFAPKGTYVLRKNAEFFDSTVDVASIINSASAGDVVELLKDVTLTANVTVPKGVLLYVPFRSGWSVDDAAGKYRAGGFKDFNATTAINTTDHYVTLTVDSGVALTVKGTLAVGSVVGYNSQRFQGHISGTHGRITNNGSITVDNGGTMTCYGLVDGNGTVHVEDGGILREMFVIGDFAGGSNTQDLFFTNQMPFKRFSMQRVQCTLTMEAQSTLMAMMNIWALSMYNEAEVVLVGNDDEAAFRPTSTVADTVTLTRKYDAGKSLTDGNGLLDVTGIGRTEWIFSNGLVFQPLTVSVGGITVNTGNSDFTIPYNFKIRLVQGEYNIPLGMRIMPGAEVIVEKGASVNIGGRLMVLDGLVQTDMSYDRYPTRAELVAGGFSGSGELTVNGTLTMEQGATLGGVVKNGGTGKLVICEGVYLNNSGDMTKLDPAKELKNHPYDQYTSEGGVSVTESGTQKIHNWVQQDGALGEYDENTTWFNLPARIYMDGTLQKVEAGKTYLAEPLEAAETVSYEVNYLYVKDGVYGEKNGEYQYLTSSGKREMTWATETVSRTMTGVWVDSEGSDEKIEVKETSVAGFSADEVTITYTYNKSGTSTVLSNLQVKNNATGAVRSEKFVFLVKYTTEGDPDGKTVKLIDGVYTIPPEANGVKIEGNILGDVNGDGFVAVDDANLISLYLAKKVTLGELAMLAADVNDDTFVAVDDANGVSLHLAKKILIFPVS